MKLSFKLLTLTLLVSLFNSCEEETVYKKCEKCLPLYIVYENNDTTSFTYNRNNQIIEINYLNSYSAESFEYNEKNQMVRFNKFRNEELDKYILFEYENNHIRKSMYFRDFKVAGEFELDYSEEYITNENGAILVSQKNNSHDHPISFIEYEYDSKGNLKELNEYNYTDYNSNDYYLEHATTRKYGDNFFYYKDLDLPIHNHYKILNNLTEQITYSYDYYTGELSSTNILYMQYHNYNDYGYPTSVSKASENGVWLKYKEIVYIVID